MITRGVEGKRRSQGLGCSVRDPISMVSVKGSN